MRPLHMAYVICLRQTNYFLSDGIWGRDEQNVVFNIHIYISIYGWMNMESVAYQWK